MKLRLSTSACPRTVLHIEHDLLTIDFVQQILAGARDFRHVGIASTGLDGIEFTKKLRPEIAILGLIVRGIDAFTIIDELARLPAAPRILLFTALGGEATLLRISQSAVDGVVWKTPDAPRELLSACRAVLNGRTYFPATFHLALRECHARPDAFSKFLSDRELELMPLFGRGLSDAEVAKCSGISVSTAHPHRQRIMAKLDLHGIAELMRWAVEKGFIHEALPAAPCCVVH